MTTHIDFSKFPIDSKVQSYDKDGYYVMNACGVVAEHLGNGYAIIKSFSGHYYSTVNQSRIAEVEQL